MPMESTIRPLFSIITTSKNSENHLEQTIQSVINQTYYRNYQEKGWQPVEYIIVDGASQDKTLDIVGKYKDKITTLVTNCCGGPFQGFNKGLELATGELIFFLNSDDYFYDSRVLETVWKYYIQQKSAKIIYANVLLKDEITNFTHLVGKPLTLNDFKNDHMYPHQSAFINNEVYKKHNFFDLGYKIASDFDFAVKSFISDEKNAHYLNTTIAVFRWGGHSTRSEARQLAAEERMSIITKYFGEIKTQAKNTTTSDNSKMTVSDYYLKWFELLMGLDKGISHILTTYNIKKVAIFGTMRAGLYMLRDMNKEGFEVKTYLDNNNNMQGKTISGISINTPEWLKTNVNNIDAVIITIENPVHEIEVCTQLSALLTTIDHEKRVSIISWKQLIVKNLDLDKNR